MTEFREFSKFLLAGSLSAFLLYGSMLLYGDNTVTIYTVLMTGIYLVCCSVISLLIHYIIKYICIKKAKV